jgi:hypothetical protein
MFDEGNESLFSLDDSPLSHVSPGFGSARVRKGTAGLCHFGAGSVTTDVAGLHAHEGAIVLAKR